MLNQYLSRMVRLLRSRIQQVYSKNLIMDKTETQDVSVETMARTRKLAWVRGTRTQSI